MSAAEAIHPSEGRMNDSGDPDECLNGIACVGGGETKESASCDRELLVGASASSISLVEESDAWYWRRYTLEAGEKSVSRRSSGCPLRNI